MNVFCGICFALLMSLTSAASASDFYGVLGHGQSSVQERKRPPKLREYEAHGEKVSLGVSSEADGKSMVTQLGLGYVWGRYLSTEVAYWRGFKAEVRYQATVKHNDDHVTSIEATHRIEMDGCELSLVPTWPVSEKFSLTGRVGAFWAQGQQRVTSPVFRGYSIAMEPEKKLLPVLGVGLRYRLSQQGTTVAVEHIGINKKYGLTTVAFRVRF